MISLRQTGPLLKPDSELLVFLNDIIDIDNNVSDTDNVNVIGNAFSCVWQGNEPLSWLP